VSRLKTDTVLPQYIPQLFANGGGRLHPQCAQIGLDICWFVRGTAQRGLSRFFLQWPNIFVALFAFGLIGPPSVRADKEGRRKEFSPIAVKPSFTSVLALASFFEPPNANGNGCQCQWHSSAGEVSSPLNENYYFFNGRFCVS
jgi:hypothetical protein